MYRIYLADHFLRQLKRYSKKFHALEEDVLRTLHGFSKEQAIYLGHRIYKIRLRASDIPTGKRNAFRLILFVVETHSIVTPITLYMKSERADITAQEVKHHLAMVLADIERLAFTKK